MLRPHYFILLVSLLGDGGTVAPQAHLPEPDAGMGTAPSSLRELDAGTVAPQPVIVEGLRWPEEVRPLATLDGPAVLAAHAALQHLLARFAKEGYAGACGYSAKGLEVVVGQEGGLYFVLINQRMDKCGWVVPPGFSSLTDWFELYAVSPEGRVLARYPYSP